MNHWLQKKKDREIAQCYLDYAKDQWNLITSVYEDNSFNVYVDGMRIIAEGYCPQNSRNSS